MSAESGCRILADSVSWRSDRRVHFTHDLALDLGHEDLSAMKVDSLPARRSANQLEAMTSNRKESSGPSSIDKIERSTHFSPSCSSMASITTSSLISLAKEAIVARVGIRKFRGITFLSTGSRLGMSMYQAPK